MIDKEKSLIYNTDSHEESNFYRFFSSHRPSSSPSHCARARVVLPFKHVLEIFKCRKKHRGESEAMDFRRKSNLLQKNFLLRFSIQNFPCFVSLLFLLCYFFIIAPFIRKTHACICASLHRYQPFECFGVDTQYILFSHKKMDGNHHSVRKKSVGFKSYTTTHYRRRRYFQLLHETSLHSSRPPNHPSLTLLALLQSPPILYRFQVCDCCAKTKLIR